MTAPSNPARLPVPVSRPPDFEEFWTQILDQLAARPLDATADYDPLRSTEDVEVYDIHYQSLDGVRISGWYTRPRASVIAPPYPGLLLVPGYVSDPVIPKDWARRGYAALAVAPRGKVRSRDRVDAAYPGLLLQDAVDPNAYAYRAFFADACRAVDFMTSRGEVDTARIGVHGSSQGGALTVVLAALRRDVIVCGAAGAPYLAGYLTSAALTRSYPYHEITEHLRLHPEQRQALENTFAYFDILNFAPMITQPMLVYIGLADDVCPPETGFALYECLRGEKELITTPRCAHDAGARWVTPRVEAFLAGHLEPRAAAIEERVAG